MRTLVRTMHASHSTKSKQQNNYVRQMITYWSVIARDGTKMLLS